MVAVGAAVLALQEVLERQPLAVLVVMGQLRL